MSINEIETRRYLLKTRVEKAINLSLENVNRKIYIMLPKMMEDDYLSNISIKNDGRIITIRNGRFIIINIDRELFNNQILYNTFVETLVQLTFEKIIRKQINIEEMLNNL